MAIVDWREVPTYSEFEILRDAFTALGVPTMICDPRDLEYVGVAKGGPHAGLYSGTRRIDLVYRRVLINDIIARADDCRALLQAYEQRAVCVANSLRCKIPHKKAFFAVLTDDRYAGLFSADERAMIARHVPWTALVEERQATIDGRMVDLVHMTIDAACGAGFGYLQHNIALRAAVRDGDLIARPSFWQLSSPV